MSSVVVIYPDDLLELFRIRYLVPTTTVLCVDFEIVPVQLHM